MSCLGGVKAYRELCDTTAKDNYEGFIHSRSEPRNQGVPRSL
jgi:hypothetical protein